MASVLVSGSSGFIGGYVVQELLARGHEVIGIDDFSKYGRVAHSYDDHPGFRLVEGDAHDTDLMAELLLSCDHFIAGAAMSGGISYFHVRIRSPCHQRANHRRVLRCGHPSLR